VSLVLLGPAGRGGRGGLTWSWPRCRDDAQRGRGGGDRTM